MPSVSVLVPYRTDDGGRRDQALRYTHRWWGEHHPDWQVVYGTPGDGPWCKATAVRHALAASSGELLVVADADVICPGVGAAVDAVAGGAAWAVPHQRVLRLTPAATDQVYAGGPLPEPAAPQRRHPTVRPTVIAEAYRGVVGGGMAVLPRRLYERVPLDPRFVGWGQEDESWGLALTVLAGPPWRGSGPLWHLWHPRPERMTRAIGNMASLELFRRYRAATTPETMLRLLSENTPGTC
jgi:hypothetical protein